MTRRELFKNAASAAVALLFGWLFKGNAKAEPMPGRSWQREMELPESLPEVPSRPCPPIVQDSFRYSLTSARADFDMESVWITAYDHYTNCPASVYVSWEHMYECGNSLDMIMSLDLKRQRLAAGLKADSPKPPTKAKGTWSREDALTFTDTL